VRASLGRTFKAFSYRDYRLLWAGAFLSSVGTWMQKVAQSWLILDITKSSFYLGLDAFLGDLPFLAFSLFGGVLADRIDRRRILLGSQLVQLTSAVILTVLVYKGVVPIWVILVLSFVVGLAQSFGGPAYQALVPALVDKEDLPNAVALNSIQFNLARVIGPVLAGVAFYKLGAAACFGLNGLSFVAVIFAILALKRGEMTAAAAKEPVLASLRTGLAAVRDARALRGLVGLAFVGSFCAMPLVTFLPVFAKDIFLQDAKGYAGLLAAFGIGAVIGAVSVAGFVGQVKRKGTVAVAMQMSFGALLIAFALSKNLYLSYAILFFSGACLMVVFALFMTLVQTNVDDAMRGRVVSVYTLAFRGAMPLGNLFAGLVSPLVTVPVALMGNGLLLVMVGLTVLLRRNPDGVTKL